MHRHALALIVAVGTAGCESVVLDVARPQVSSPELDAGSAPDSAGCEICTPAGDELGVTTALGGTLELRFTDDASILSICGLAPSVTGVAAFLGDWTGYGIVGQFGVWPAAEGCATLPAPKVLRVDGGMASWEVPLGTWPCGPYHLDLRAGDASHDSATVDVRSATPMLASYPPWETGCPVCATAGRHLTAGSSDGATVEVAVSADETVLTVCGVSAPNDIVAVFLTDPGGSMMYGEPGLEYVVDGCATFVAPEMTYFDFAVMPVPFGRWPCGRYYLDLRVGNTSHASASFELEATETIDDR